MRDSEWLDAAGACAALGVRRQTLYAYVSRHRIAVRADPRDPRRSLYAAYDVARIASVQKRPRARAEVAASAIRWGEPVLPTRISGIHEGTLWFGSRRAVDLACEASLEEVAAHHWGVAVHPFGSCGPTSAGVASGTPVHRVSAMLAQATDGAKALEGRTRPAVAVEAAMLCGWIADVAIGHRAEGPVHARLRAAWDLSAADADLVRRVLVLLSDHELNPSTFAVRICASTGASLPLVLLAGLAALSGPRHGGTASLAARAFAADPARGLPDDLKGRSPYTYGFGHPAYPAGDPRATAVLEAMGTRTHEARRVRALAKTVGAAPNVDAAVAALCARLMLPPTAHFVMFLVARATGWVAHAVEQLESDAPIRPRAVFLEGDTPDP